MNWFSKTTEKHRLEWRWPTFRTICVWIENNLDVVELSVAKEDFLKAFLIRVEGQVSKCERDERR